jgi:hypothetical protein
MLNMMSYQDVNNVALTQSGNAVQYLDFLNDRCGQAVGELGSTIDTNILAASGVRLQMLQDITTGGSTSKINYVSHRIYGDISQLKLGLKKG